MKMRIVMLLLLIANSVFAQTDVKNTVVPEAKKYTPAVDTSLVKSYERHFSASVFLQKKLVSLGMTSKDEEQHDIIYRPNSALVLGLGINYRYLSLSAGISVYQQDKETTVKSKSFDFQTEIADKRYISFLYLQHYKGFFSKNPLLKDDKNNFYGREDIGMTLIGASTYFELNKKFSFSGNLSTLQWQKSSSGSPLIAFDIFYNLKRADSAFVPKQFADFYENSSMRRQRVWSFGPGVGYAHNQVFLKKFFISGIVSFKVPVNFIAEKEVNGRTTHRRSFGLNLGFWGKVGYNEDRWNITFFYMNTRIPIGGNIIEPDYANNSGSIRLAYTRRFVVNRKVKKVLKPVDKILNKPYEVMDGIR